MTPLHHISRRTRVLPPLRVGVGGPVGSGKTTLVEMLCKAMRDRFDLVVVTNDIYTKEDQRLLTVAGALDAERIMGVETGGCPHTAIREDASINLEAIDRMLESFPDADIVFVESGGDNLAATFSPELSDLTIYVIDVAAGEKIPRKGGPGITKSDLFVINKTDLAPYVGADLELLLIESGGDNLAATFSPELADLTIYVIDVAGGEKIPRKGGPGITRSDLLVINKTDLAPHVGASLEVMESDTRRMRGDRPFVFTNLKTGAGAAAGAQFVERAGGLE